MLPDNSIAKKLIDKTLPDNSIAKKLIDETFNLTNDLSELNDSSINAYLNRTETIIYSRNIQGDTIDKNYNKEKYLYDIIIISKLYAIIYRLYSYHYNTLNNDEEKFNIFLNDLSISFTTDPSAISRIYNNNIIFNNLFNLADLKLNEPLSSYYYNIYNIDANIFNNYYKNKNLTYKSEIINEIINEKNNEKNNENNYETHIPLYHEMINNKSFNVITLLSEYYTNNRDITIDITIDINNFSDSGTINKTNLSTKYNNYKSNTNINDYNIQRNFLYFDAYYTILNLKKYNVNTLLLEINKNMHKYYILLYNALIQYGLINIYNNKQYIPLKNKYLNITIELPPVVNKPQSYIPNLVSSTLTEIPYNSESIEIFKNNFDSIYSRNSETRDERNNRIAPLLIIIKNQLNIIILSVDKIFNAIINVTPEQDYNNKIRDIRTLISQIKDTYNNLYVSCNIQSCYINVNGNKICSDIFRDDILVFITIIFELEKPNYKAIYDNINDKSINGVERNPINANIDQIISNILENKFKNNLYSIYENYIRIRTLFDEHISYRVDFSKYEQYLIDKIEYDEYTFYISIKSKYEVPYTHNLIDINKLSYNLNKSIANDSIKDIKNIEDIKNIKDIRNIDNILSIFTNISGKYKNEWKLYNKGVYYYRILLSISIFCFIIILIISTININKNIIIGIFIIKIILILLLILFIYKKPNIEKFTSSSTPVEDIYYNNYYKLYIETINNYKTIKINNSDKSQYLFNNLVKTFDISKKNYANYANEYSNKIEYYKTKTIDLNGAIQVLKITNMQNYYIILLIYVSFIFILIGLILYFIYPNSLYKIVISVVIFYLLTLMILFIQIHKISSMDKNKNYWSNLNPSLDDLD